MRCKGALRRVTSTTHTNGMGGGYQGGVGGWGRIHSLLPGVLLLHPPTLGAHQLLHDLLAWTSTWQGSDLVLQVGHHVH
jgi:hypothetical protein